MALLDFGPYTLTHGVRHGRGLCQRTAAQETEETTSRVIANALSHRGIKEIGSLHIGSVGFFSSRVEAHQARNHHRKE